MDVNHHYYHPHMMRYNWPEPAYHTGYRQITMQEAMNIAVERVPGQIVKVELERENGIWVYEVDIITSQGVKYEVEVDVNTGNIVQVELD